MNIKKIVLITGISTISVGLLWGGYKYFFSNDILDIPKEQINKNLVKKDELIDKKNLTESMSKIQSGIRNSNDLMTFLKTKYPSVLQPNSTVEYNSKIDMYQLINGLQILYISKDGKNLYQGHIYDLATGFDYTDAKLAEISKIDTNTIPLGDAIKMVNGTGKKVLYVFAYLDDNLKKYYNETLSNINDTTIYLFLQRSTYSPNDDQYVSSYKDRLFKFIQCSDNKEQEFSNYLKPGKFSPVTNNIDKCGEYLQKIKDDIDFEKYKIVYSPTIFTSNGYRYKAIPEYQLKDVINQSESSNQNNPKNDKLNSSSGVGNKLGTPNNSMGTMGVNSK